MFIVIEGIDGAGCETQATTLYKALKNSSHASYIKFPHYDNAVGKMIHRFLYDNKSLEAKQQFLLYSLQFIDDTTRISKLSREGLVVADRYFTSTICFQTLEGIEEKVALRFAADFGIIKPDLVFYLDVDPEVAIKWKYGENKPLNFREKDLAFMKKTYSKYNDLVTRQVWTKWIKINGNQKKEQVTQDILKYL